MQSHWSFNVHNHQSRIKTLKSATLNILHASILINDFM
jgi:hypothetical protein